MAIQPMPPNLHLWLNEASPVSDEAWKKVIADLPPTTPEQSESQRRSFVYGNVKLANPDVTRELVDEVAEKDATPSA